MKKAGKELTSAGGLTVKLMQTSAFIRDVPIRSDSKSFDFEDLQILSPDLILVPHSNMNTVSKQILIVQSFYLINLLLSFNTSRALL